jgi:ribonuclease P/MRP protein subunit RPP1
MSFIDVNVNSSDKDVILTAIRLGYNAVAINTNVKSYADFAKQKYTPVTPLNLEKFSTPEIAELSHLKLSQVKNFKQHTRITLPYEEKGNQNFTFSNVPLQKFDIVAAIPANEKEFHNCCENAQIDIISIPVPLNFPIRVKDIKIALARGIMFEIAYTKSLRDQTYRRNIIKDGNFLVTSTLGRNIILSSGANMPLDLRGPYDVINLGFLFGLDNGKAKQSLTNNVLQCLKHGEARKASGSILIMQNISSLSLQDQQKIPNPQVIEIKNEDDNEDMIPEENKIPANKRKRSTPNETLTNNNNNKGS